MGSAVFRVFGGLMPSVEPRSLPAEAAQVAENLDLRFGDFRPVKGLGTSISTVAAAAKSVFRTASGVWLSSASDVDFVPAQLQDTAVERVYLSGRSAFPEAWEGGTYRRLGVPAPTSAPTVTVEVVEEFSTTEMVHARTAIPNQVLELFNDNLVSALYGPTLSPTPTTTAPGWLAHGVQPDLPTRSAQQYAFCVPMELSGADYVMKDPDAHNFLLLGDLGGKRISYSGSPYWAVPLYVKGQGQTVNSTAITAGLKLIMSPANSAVRLWTDPEVDEIVNRVVVAFDPARDPQKTLIEGVSAAMEGLDRVYAAVTTQVNLKAAMTAFFQRSEVTAQITGLIGTSTGSSALTNNPNSGAFTQRVAQACYHMGVHNPDGTSNTVSDTRYFHVASDDVTATNIRADLNGFISVDRRGVKVVDKVGMARKFRDELYLIVNQRALGSRWSTAAIESAVAECIAILEEVFSDSNWSTNPAWPYNMGVERQGASSAMSAREVLKAACDAVTERFERIQGIVRGYIRDELFDLDVLTKLPTPIDRILESRAYFYTYVTDWGEESAPSPVSALFDCDQNDIVTVQAAIPPAGKFIRRIRLYRSSTSNTATAFQFVIENPADVSDAAWSSDITNRTLIDLFRQEQLGEPCPSLTWDEPPANGRGMLNLPNGVVILFDGARVCPCEPFYPYAYPVDYQQTMDFPYVAAGVFGQTAVILTTGNPYYCSGADSASLSLQKMESNQSCISKRSVSGGDGGLFFVSPDGLCLATPSGIQVITEGVYSRADWEALDPSNSFGRYHDGMYYLFLQTSGVCLVVDMKAKRISTMSIAATGAYSDLATDTLYVVQGTSLLPMFKGSPLTGRWRSKVMSSSSWWMYSCAKVDSDFDAPVTMRLYGDGALIHTATFPDREPQRLPDGRYRDVEVEFESTGRFASAVIASSMKDLGTQ